MFFLRSLLLFSAITLIHSQEKKPTSYQVDRQKLREMWYVATLKGLLKAKSRESLPQVQAIDAILYKQCERDAKSAIDLARCTVKLFNAREAEKLRQAELARQSANEDLLLKEHFPYSTAQTRVKAKTKKKKNSSDHWIHIRPLVDMDAVLSDFQKETDTWNREKIPVNERQRTEKDLGELAAAYERVILKQKKDRWKREAGIERKKRKVEPLMQLSKNSLDYSKVAAEFFKDLIGSDPVPIQHLENLRLIKGHFEKTKKIKDYYSLMDDENSRLYSQLKLPIRSREPSMQQATEDDVLDDVLSLINSFAATQLSKDTKVSILSPRIFSILPEGSSGSTRLLSPNMFSFQKDGIFSLPDMFHVLSSDQQYQKMMLEMLLDISGAGEALNTVLSKMRPEIEEMNNVHYPTMLEMSRHDHNWIRAKRSLNRQQWEQYERHGFAYLDESQMELVYGIQRFSTGPPLNITRLAAMSQVDREKDLEAKIRELAKREQPHERRKREILMDRNITLGYQHDHDGVEPGDNETEPHAEQGHVLQPLAFTNFIAHGEVLEAVVLSPRAFIQEIMAPEFMVLRVLEPEAFIFSLLTPAALTARILSPAALRAEVLSPRAFYPWILSPEALLTEVLTPVAFNPRVLSPEVLVIKVLSPAMISPNVGSGEMLAVLVLSPNILSPRIASEEFFIVEILSPHILGGPHGKHDASVISIGGGEHDSEHEHGDEHSAAHRGDVHVHQGSVEGEHAHDDHGTPVENIVRDRIDAIRG